ncbi:molecular chaperone DjiA [Aggregicoccus sp. 17bor-14]|uniref:TerB family tellurite resistance protein n=1 Tax=Myxococcaceae TaxID=31 RepID=UPI00129CF44F|nr:MULTISPECIES: TerB family tellurite resistance protein [Myxococcaceae]MBF5041208.1 TerB family tellurite resistance protein [Simulacricoccus sp. 17bor-14]MRI86995.1 molecular chaperone DjiA [Aggregicoccus sp. 17bor-14]
MGKLVGALLGLGLGLAVGNPLGAVLLVGVGLLAGHLYDDLRPLPAPSGPDLTADTCALLLEVARADGEPGREELRAVREHFADALGYGPQALGAVRRCLKAQLQAPRAPGPAAVALREVLGGAERLRLFEALWTLALADGRASNAEVQALRRVAGLLGIPAEAQAEREQRSLQPPAEPAGHASYAALGVAADASDAAVRRAFRRLAAQAHPDRVAHLGRAEGERATLRFQELERAYAEIRRLRGR